MTDRIFSLVGLLAALGWLPLALFPRRRWAEVVGGRVVPALLAAVYAAIIAAKWGQSPGGFSSLAAVSELFESRWLLLAGWVHYLAFDLVVGSWMVADARERGIAHGWVLPLLPLTLLFGPVGWLSYLGLRAVLGARTRAQGIRKRARALA